MVTCKTASLRAQAMESLYTFRASWKPDDISYCNRFLGFARLKQTNNITSVNQRVLDIHHGVSYLFPRLYQALLRALYIALDGCSLREIAVGSSPSCPLRG